MEIIMHNVEFGEYIDCLVNNRKVLTVDCGTILKVFPHGLPLLNNNIPIMVSHMHIDHYKGFLYSARIKHNKFKKMYLPFISCEAQDVLLEAALYDIYINGTRSSYAKILSLRHMLEICDINNIEFLKRGDKIPEIQDAEVLWPYKNNQWFNEKLCELCHLIHKLRKIVIEKSPYDEIMLTINSFLLSKIYKKILNHSKNDKDISLSKEIETIDKILLQYKDCLRESDEESKISNIILNIENDCSIVFSNRGLNGRYLFTGDITKQVQDYLFNASSLNKNRAIKYKRKYKFVKLPHHGTEDYFDALITPISEKYAVSNGRSHHSSWKISPNIVSLPNLVFCTNGCNGACYCAHLSSAIPNHCYKNHICYKGDIKIIV